MKSKASLRIVLVLSLLVAAVLFYQAQAGNQDSEAAPSSQAPPPPKVTIAPVEQRTVINHRELLGRVEARESVEVRPRVSGHIASVQLQAGQTVKKGDVLFVIDPRWYQAAFNLAQANAKSAEVRVGIKQRDARRAEELVKSRAISL
jgi:multidrug efflux pump subunit AcrA (membrane-fusion protein)